MIHHKIIWITIFCVVHACAMKRGREEGEKQAITVPIGKLDYGFFLLALSHTSLAEIQEQCRADKLYVENTIMRPYNITGFAGEVFEKIDRQYQQLPTDFQDKEFIVLIDNCTQAIAYIENGILADKALCKSCFNDFATLKKIIEKVEYDLKK